MDTQNATNDVPTFKLAKVGKERDRKRGGAGWFNGANGTGGLSGLGAGGAEGAGGLASLFGGMSLAKGVMVLLITGLLSAGAWQFGKMFSSSSAPASKKLFADKNGSQKYGDTSDVVKSDNSIPNSLGYVSGSLDGMTAEERAKKAAEEEAARKAAEDAAKKQADEDAAKAAAADKTPTDAVAGAATGGTAPAPMSNPFSSRFGGLSNGLSGGAGLSGGIGQGFGGMGAGGVGQKGVNGTLGAMKNSAPASTSRAAAHPMSPLSGKNLAFGQLKQTSSASRSAAGTSGEGSASTASQPFDGGSNSGGTSIDGPGVGAGATTGAGVGGANTSGGAPVGGGGGSSCADGQATDANGSCVSTNTPSGSDAQPMIHTEVMMAEALMAILAILAVIVVITQGKGPIGEAIAKILQTVMELGGLVIAGLGAAILAQGDTITGGIVAATGVAVAAWAYFNPANVISSTAAVNMAAGGLIATALGGLATSATSASSVSTQ